MNEKHIILVDLCRCDSSSHGAGSGSGKGAGSTNVTRSPTMPATIGGAWTDIVSWWKRENRCSICHAILVGADGGSRTII